jgi:ribosomal protein S12 methylthiotransferase
MRGNACPDVALRTTFIVGFPGETDEQFGRLYDFVAEMEFDHVGVFVYSREQPTPSARMEDPVPPGGRGRAPGRTHGTPATHLVDQETRHSSGKSFPSSSKALGKSKTRGETALPSRLVGQRATRQKSTDSSSFLRKLPLGEFVTVRIIQAEPYDLWG